MGRPGRRLPRTPSQGALVSSPRCLPRGNRPLYPSTNQSAPSCPCPCALDRALQSLGPSPSCKPSHFGVSSFLVIALHGKRRRVVGEERRRGEGGGRAHRRHQCAKTRGRLCSRGAVPVTAREAEVVRVGWELEQRRSSAPPHTSTPRHRFRQAGDDYTTAPQ
jgi:hypothetical protein